MRRALSVFMVFCTLAIFASCKQNNVVVPENGYVATGQLEDVMRTFFFDFSVLSVQESPDFKQVVIHDKTEKFVVAEIAITNTSNETITMYDTDFQLQWGTDGFSDTIGFAHNSMAPVQQKVLPGQQMQCYYVFTAPKTVNAFKICYIDNKHLLDDSPLTPQSFYVAFTT